MRQELTEKIMMCLMGRGINEPDIAQDITIILSDYDITARETAVAVRNQDINQHCLKKFLIAKTVKGCSDRTIEQYETQINRILNEIGKSVSEITSDDIRLYIALRERRDKCTKTTVDNERRYLSSFFKFLVNEEMIEKDPTARIGQIKMEKKKKPAFKELEVEKIRNACTNAFETAAVEMMLSTGCRVSELCNIKISEIDGDKLIVHGKGNKDRTVYLNAKAIVAVENYMKERTDSNPYLFPGGYFKSGPKDRGKWYMNVDKVDKERRYSTSGMEGKVRKIGKRAGVENVFPHRFRRTCATLALRRGMPLEQVSKMLGHEDLSTTQIYLDLSEEDLRMAHKKFVI